jgi:hypothetical protein
MSFPQFYLHYNVKTDSVIQVTREAKVEQNFVIAIPLTDTLSKALLAGTINECDLLVNKYAHPPTVIDKSMFPKDLSYYFIFSVDNQEIVKIMVKKPDPSELAKNKQNSVEIDNRIAYSILSGDTSFSDWVVVIEDDGKVSVNSQAQCVRASNLFKHRIDFLSLAEISLAPKKAETSGLPKLCDIIVNFAENTLSVKCPDISKDYFKDFFLAVTNKNDPSYLIKYLEFKPNDIVNLSFKDKKLKDISFFTSRFHLRNSAIMVLNKITGEIIVTFNEDTILVENNLEFNEELPNAVIVLKNKYDSSQVYRTITLTDNSSRTFKCPKSVDLSAIEVDTVKLSKKFIKIIR